MKPFGGTLRQCFGAESGSASKSDVFGGFRRSGVRGGAGSGQKVTFSAFRRFSELSSAQICVRFRVRSEFQGRQSSGRAEIGAPQLCWLGFPGKFGEFRDFCPAAPPVRARAPRPRQTPGQQMSLLVYYARPPNFSFLFFNFDCILL